ncbi:hypothetical protein R80B4_02498 [Fibrobacteres bacterium R8-0-B4]
MPLPSPFWKGFPPVSYTHLDVYKRQILSSVVPVAEKKSFKQFALIDESGCQNAAITPVFAFTPAFFKQNGKRISFLKITYKIYFSSEKFRNL